MQPTTAEKAKIPRASSVGTPERRPGAAALAFGGPPLPPLPASPPRTAFGSSFPTGFDSENYLASDPEAFGAVFSGHDSEAELKLIFSKRQVDARAAEELRTHMPTPVARAMPNPIEILLQSLAKNAFHSKVIHTFLPTETIAGAMQVFAEHHILSAPVLDRMLASVDLADCLAHALHVKHTIKQRHMLSAILQQTTIADVLKVSAVEPPCLLPAETATVYDVFRELGTLGGKHRVLLIEKNGAISRFISQSDCVCLVKGHAAQNADVQAMLSAPIESFVSNRVSVVKPVNTILETGRVRDAIFRLVHLGGALPIVTRQGELVAHMSKSDLKQLLDVRGIDFEQNVVEFLQHFSPKSLKPIRMDPKASFFDTMNVRTRVSTQCCS